MLKRSVICLLGATATGKTELVLKLAEHFPIEIVSVDSALIYRGMDIGTAKPDRATRDQIPHYLVDIKDPEVAYSVGHFVRDAHRCILDILSRDRLPVLVGGTMMYFHALQHGLDFLPSGDPYLKKQLLQRLEQEGLLSLYSALQQVDPDLAERVAEQDTQRILRGLEVYELTGKPLSLWQREGVRSEVDADYQYHNIILHCADRLALHERIERRFRSMIDQGFIEEVQVLRERKTLSLEAPSMRCVGYRQVWQYLEGHCDQEEMFHRGVIATRQLAKRQMTWLRGKWKTAIHLETFSPKLYENFRAFISEHIRY